MKPIIKDWNEYNKVEKVAVIIQLIATVVVLICVTLILTDVIDNNDVAEIGFGLIMITMGIREWRRNKLLSVLSFAVALFIAITAVFIITRRNAM